MANWKDNPASITFTSPTDNSWETYDAGADGDWPSGGTGAMGVIINNSTSTDLKVGWRMKGSSDSFTFDVLSEFMVGWYCGTDGNDEIEFFCEDWSEVTFYVSGFFGSEATFFSTAVDKSQTTTGSWVEGIDVTSDTSASATHLIFQAYPTSDSTNTFGARDGDSTRAIQDNIARGTGGIVSLTSGQEFDQYISNAVVDFKILGYLESDWTTDSASGSDISVTTGAWTTRTINASATGVIVELFKSGGGGDTFTFRTDSGDTEIGGEISKTWLPIKCNGSGEIDILGGSPNVDTYWNIYSTAVAGGVTVTPSAVTAVAAKNDPTVVLGSLTVSPSASTAIAATADPTVQLGSISLTPSAVTTVAVSVDPAVEIGSITVSPAAATAVAGKADPTVVQGSLSITPAASTAVAVSVDPAVDISSGDVTVSPSAATCVASTADPAVILGSVSVSPSASTAIAVSVDPTVDVSGGGTVVSPDPVTAVAASVDPGVVLGAVAITPEQATAIASGVDPTLVMSSISIQAGFVSAVASSVDPTVTIAEITAALESLTAPSYVTLGVTVPSAVTMALTAPTSVTTGIAGPSTVD